MNRARTARTRRTAAWVAASGGLALLTLPGSAGAQEVAPGVERVSADLRAAVARLADGERLPVIVEFAVPGGKAAVPRDEGAAAVPPGVTGLRSRAASALAPLDALAAGAGDHVEVTERLWIVPAATAEITEAGLERLLATPGVRRVVPDDRLAVALEPTARAFAPPSYTSDAMRTIGADAVWEAGATGDGVVIAFFDSGVDGGNAMVSNRWRGLRTSTRASWFDPYLRASTPQDAIGHGTQVAVAAVGALAGGDTLELADGSTIVAAGDLDVVTGPAPRAEWIAARVFENYGNGVFTRRSVLLQAFQWALDPDGNPSTDDAPDIINNSWGILPTSSFDLCTDVLYTAIDAADAAGIAVLFSAGNTGPAAGTVAFPAARDDAGLASFAVGASSGTTTIDVAGYSGRGPSPCGGTIKPDIVAPGTVPEVRGAGPGRARLTGFTVQGTSFSTAQASGALALLRQERGSDGPEQLKRLLTGSAVDLGIPGPDNDAGSGLLDVPAALSDAGFLVADRLIQVASATADPEGLSLRLRNRGRVAWPGGRLRVEAAGATGATGWPGGAGGTGRVLGEADLPAIAPGAVLAARLPWAGAADGPPRTVRAIVTDPTGVVLDRLVVADPPDGFGGFVLAAGDLAAGANDFGRLGRLATFQGFAWRGTDYLPAGGIAVAAGGVVSDGWYATTLGRFDLKRFGPAAETDWAPQRGFTDVEAATADLRFDDFEALAPAGLEVSGAYEATDADGAGALALNLTIRNRGSASYADVIVGVLVDWDFAGGEDVQWVDADDMLVATALTGGGPVAVLAADTTVASRVELPLGTPGTGSAYEPGSGVLADSLVDDVKLDLLRGTAGTLPGAGTATDNAAVLGVGPFDLAVGGELSVRFWLLAADDEATAAARLAALRAAGRPPPPGGGGERFAAEPPFPNPLTPGDGIARFPYTLSDADADRGGDMALEIYDLSGRRIYRQRESLAPGGAPPVFTWDGRLGGGDAAASGVYLYVIRLDDRTVSGRLLVRR